MWQSQPSRTEGREKVVGFDKGIKNMVNIRSLPQKSSTKTHVKHLTVFTSFYKGFKVSLFHTAQTFFMQYYYWIISGLPAVSVVTWHGFVWDTQLGVPLNQLGISPGLSGITWGWRRISSDCLFQGREGHRLAKLPLTQAQGTGGGTNHTHSGTTCNLNS